MGSKQRKIIKPTLLVALKTNPPMRLVVVPLGRAALGDRETDYDGNPIHLRDEVQRCKLVVEQRNKDAMGRASWTRVDDPLVHELAHIVRLKTAIIPKWWHSGCFWLP